MWQQEGVHILFDCDGVLSDFTNHYLRTVGSSLSAEDIKSFDIFAYVTSDQKTYGERRLALGEWWSDMPEYPHAREALEKARRLGSSLRVITSPWDSCREWLHARVSWLHDRGVARNEVGVLHDKDRYVGDVMIEDHPRKIVSWLEAHPKGRGFLVDHAYNREVSHPRLVRVPHALAAVESL